MDHIVVYFISIFILFYQITVHVGIQQGHGCDYGLEAKKKKKKSLMNSDAKNVGMSSVW